jgi:hypothetical protein
MAMYTQIISAMPSRWWKALVVVAAMITVTIAVMAIFLVRAAPKSKWPEVEQDTHGPDSPAIGAGGNLSGEIIIANPPDPWRSSVEKRLTALEAKQKVSLFSPQFIDEARQSLEKAYIAFNVPRSMRLGETVRIALLFSFRESPDQLIERLKNQSAAVGEKESAVIHVSNRMQARLTGEGFTITAIMPELQVIGTSEITEWKWHIKAITPGRHTLHMTLSAIVYLETAQTPLAIHTFDRQIEVVVSWYHPIGSFVGNNWQWLWTALLVPVGGWLWTRYFRRRNSDNLIS